MPKPATPSPTCATSTLHISFSPTALAPFLGNHQVFCATMPPAMIGTKDKRQQQHWYYSAAREQLSLPHCFGPQKCYVLAPKGAPSPPPLALQGYTKQCPFVPLTTLAAPADRLACMRLLLAHYYTRQQAVEHPTSNDHLYLYIRRTKHYLHMLEFTLVPDWHLSHQDTLVLQVRDKATRFKELTPQAYRKEAAYRKRTPYGLADLGNALGEGLRPLKKAEAKAVKHLYVHSTSKHRKTHVDHFSIASQAAMESSRLGKLATFLARFIPHLQAMGLQVSQYQRTLQAISPPKPTKREKHAPPPHLAYLPHVHLLDGRKAQADPTPIAAIREACHALQVATTPIAELQALAAAPPLPTLFVMDYNQGAFEEGEEDPYQAFKALGKQHAFPTQALEVKGDQQALQRNLSVCLSELMLKQHIATTSPPPWPYHQALLQHWVFLYDQHLLYMEEGCLRIAACHDRQTFPQGLSSLYAKIAQQTHTDPAQVKQAYTACAHSLKKRHPNARSSDDPLQQAHLLFGPDTLLEIENTHERVFYYDLEQVSQRLQPREATHPREAFLLQDQAARTHSITPDQQAAYNCYVKQHVESPISYERLRKKHRKALFQALGIQRETKLVQCLATQGLSLKGKKEGRIFKAYEGIWYDVPAQAYYVGKQLSYNTVQDKGFCTYRIHTYAGTFTPATYFPLLTVDFVRHKEYTVLPYPFKMLKEYKAQHS